MEVSPKAAVVTGAASGIGDAVVNRFIDDEKYEYVACLDVDERVLDLYESDPVAHPFEVDVSDHDVVQNVLSQIEENADVHALVNNAGISRHYSLANLEPNEWDAVVDVNLKGQYNCVRAVAPGMIKRGRGYIVNVSSGAGQRGSASGGVHYSASKAGVFGLTKGLAKELAPAVSVNCVVPGLIDTPLATDSGLWAEEELAEFVKRIPLERLGEPDEVARVIQFLCGEGATYITGSVMTVDGGAALS